ncbi:36629_t:CDS:2, partial [Racocetra persica]
DILDQQAECYKSEFNAADDDHTKGKKCDEYLSTERIDATIFINMRGYDNLTQLYCYILNTSRPFNESHGVNPLVFDNSTQKIAIVLWSSKLANNTKLGMTEDHWFMFGTFTESEDYRYIKFQIVKMPSISYLYFKRIEKYGIDNNDILTGGTTGQTIQKSVELDKTFTSFAIAGFALSPNLWGLFRIIPEEYVKNVKINAQEYPVEHWNDRIEFTLFQLTANMGGFLSVLSIIYLVLFGSRRINPWGIVQRHTNDPQTQERHSFEKTCILSTSTANTDEPTIQQIKQELRDEMKSEIVKLREFL